MKKNYSNYKFTQLGQLQSNQKLKGWKIDDVSLNYNKNLK